MHGWSWLWRALLVGPLILAVAGCGQVTPTGEGLVSTSAVGANATPGVATTPALISATVAPTTAALTTGPIRTPAEAAARALVVERADLAGQHPRAVGEQWMTQGEARAIQPHLQIDGGSDADTVWWVDIEGGFSVPRSCPAAPPGGTPGADCPPITTAVVVLAAADGHVIDHFFRLGVAPTVASGVSRQIPADARLNSPGAAIAAGFRLVPGQHGKLPRLVSLRLLTGDQTLATHHYTPLKPGVPVWELEFTGANFSFSCSLQGGCSMEHVRVTLDSLTGNDLGAWSPHVVTPGMPSHRSPRR